MTSKFAAFSFFVFLAMALQAQINPSPALVIHGGAGNMRPDPAHAQRDSLATAALKDALEAGYAILENGGTAMDAVVAAIVLLEDNPVFNAGKGAVMTAEGTHELDASLMDGKTLGAGAVAGVKHVKNPIRAARMVMEKSPHVMLTGAGADAFALGAGLDSVPNDYFITPQVRKSWENSRVKGSGHHRGTTRKFGTVGAVAIDAQGNIAAGTSTGGMMNKAYGRIGDSPVIGAGTYADNSTCGVSCTGHGEYFIRAGVAKEISDRMAFGGQTLEEAAREVVHEKLPEMGGRGGIIALDGEGHIVMEFNTPGMFRGSVDAAGLTVKIFGHE